jgi:Zn finger protein HypA/HybF involved in hydrogenase expression
MSSLIYKLKSTHTDIHFHEDEEFLWSPTTRTIFYNKSLAHAPLLLLHELSHALLDHREYKRDIELVAMETAAWEKVKIIADGYNVRVYETVIQDHLDTYREWLHARSSCPHCSANGYQTEKSIYTCPACSHVWKVNEARICALRRYSLSAK